MPVATQEQLRARMKEARLRAGLSQEQAAKRLRADTRTYGRWERGESSFPLKRVEQLAKVFKVKPQDLIADRQADIDEQLHELRQEVDDLQRLVRLLRSRLDREPPE
jgi:transcriptional regulator with XRE-family HTH domain